MIPELRKRFNAAFDEARYRAFVSDLQRRCGADIHFRVSETPCFFPRELIDRLARTGVELMTSGDDGLSAQSFPFRIEVAPRIVEDPVEGQIYRAWEKFP